MYQIKLDDEFQSLSPAPDEQTYAWLSESIIKYGCRDPLVVWGDILVDGYARYRICTEHGIPYETVNRNFKSREDAMGWILSNRISQRKQTPKYRTLFQGLYKGVDEQKMKISTERVNTARFFIKTIKNPVGE